MCAPNWHVPPRKLPGSWSNNARQSCFPVTKLNMAWMGDPQIWTSFLTLTGLEIVLGIDNLVLLSLLASRLPAGQQASARRLGLVLALGTRLVLLGAISWVIHLTVPVMSLAGHDFSARDLILIVGGAFLLFQGTREIHSNIEGEEKAEAEAAPPASGSFFRTVVQIAIFDMLFSLDSVITAVGVAEELWVMVAAIVIAMFVMVAGSKPLASFIERHASVKMLALSFLLLIGTVLLADGFGFHVPRGFIYAAMAFSVLVEGLNLLMARRRGAKTSRIGADKPAE